MLWKYPLLRAPALALVLLWGVGEALALQRARWLQRRWLQLPQG
ncbi:MAG: hypothetical protein ACT4NV_09165 [Rhodoferax sp.]